mmetsp:Transcript_2743/g.10794  ORF Transcript_2743/g.10794 Transcript_2743/m.10794 type:complete len:335 (-) Transcript_2743:836-1840(-)
MTAPEVERHAGRPRWRRLVHVPHFQAPGLRKPSVEGARGLGPHRSATCLMPLLLGVARTPSGAARHLSLDSRHHRAEARPELNVRPVRLRHVAPRPIPATQRQEASPSCSFGSLSLLSFLLVFGTRFLCLLCLRRFLRIGLLLCLLCLLCCSLRILVLLLLIHAMRVPPGALVLHPLAFDVSQCTVKLFGNVHLPEVDTKDEGRFPAVHEGGLAPVRIRQSVRLGFGAHRRWLLLPPHVESPGLQGAIEVKQLGVVRARGHERRGVAPELINDDTEVHERLAVESAMPQIPALLEAHHLSAQVAARPSFVDGQVRAVERQEPGRGGGGRMPKAP